MTQEVVIILGYPASGKTEASSELIHLGYTHLNRDKAGGNVIKLLPKMEVELKAGRSVVLDNLFPTAEKRKPFIEAAKKAGVTVRCVHMTTKIEDAIINALHRMWNRYGRIFYMPEDLKECARAKKDSNMFPIAVFFRYKKEFEKISKDEGFDRIDKIKFVRRFNPKYTNKALILDYDDTLRYVKNGNYKFPICPDEVGIIGGRSKKLKEFRDQGFILLGASNQSGIARKQIGATEEEGHANAKATFDHTNSLLGVDIDYLYCPHNVPPRCYCRKPQSGMGVELINRHRLNPKDCIYVGDQTTDRTFATRLDMQYIDHKDFFKVHSIAR